MATPVGSKHSDHLPQLSIAPCRSAECPAVSWTHRICTGLEKSVLQTRRPRLHLLQNGKVSGIPRLDNDAEFFTLFMKHGFVVVLEILQAKIGLRENR